MNRLLYFFVLIILISQLVNSYFISFQTSNQIKLFNINIQSPESESSG